MPDSRPLTLTEACEYLGLSKSTMYKMTSQKVIPYYKPGKGIYFKREELDRYVFGNKILNNEEIKAEAIRRAK